MAPVERAEQCPHLVFHRAAAAEGQHLVEQGQRIAHAALGAARDRPQRGWFELDVLRLRDLDEPLLDLAERQPPQVELQAA